MLNFHKIFLIIKSKLAFPNLPPGTTFHFFPCRALFYFHVFPFSLTSLFQSVQFILFPSRILKIYSLYWYSWFSSDQEILRWPQPWGLKAFCWVHAGPGGWSWGWGLSGQPTRVPNCHSYIWELWECHSEGVHIGQVLRSLVSIWILSSDTCFRLADGMLPWLLPCYWCFPLKQLVSQRKCSIINENMFSGDEY